MEFVCWNEEAVSRCTLFSSQGICVLAYANCLAVVGVGCTIGPFVGPPCVLVFVIDGTDQEGNGWLTWYQETTTLCGACQSTWAASLCWRFSSIALFRPYLLMPVDDNELLLKTGFLSMLYFSGWFTQFANVGKSVLFDMILAANYLDIKSLLDLTCQTVADMIKGKTPEEVRKIFNIVNDFTPEEEDEVRRENAWAFE
ncbi:hypothetical protein RHMOL_Rhmol07G0279300 [Rhododendron molle]|uniref:Uncharacterized protein n=2 Tax=Rhododendron molle TaxID=49168 RepID=A0ACC0N709_RHOML|nr:hypothetical protein RHMOL_Rhmol07G0279300 [Rhododendron molle]KAI8548522.1 hypothetical protein RHMOL_Rhmol07G0279300 [Rhododendron molle]